MKFSEAAILLNCHSFEDFPVFYDGEEAESLLAAWTSLWHPTLIDQTGKKPGWYLVDELPAHDQPRLLVLPECQAGLADETLESEVASAGGLLIRNQTKRDAILELALPSEQSTATDVDSELVADLAADMMALGYAQLQVELLTRHMRYSTQMEETSFAENLVAAANAALEGNAEECRARIQTCYDFLSQERDHYYAVDIYLIDVSLTNEQLVNDQLAEFVAQQSKANLFVEGQHLALLSDASQAKLANAWEQGELSMVGGEYREVPSTLVSADTLRTQLQHGHEAFDSAFGRVPTVFGRRTFGLTTCLPQLLLRMGYNGVLHATFDGGRFPEANQSKSRWEGDGQYSIDAIMRAPMDANQPATFLKLAGSLSESIDMDHIATRGFVHWAGQTNPWYEDLQRVTKYTAALGRFLTLEEYFEETYDPGLHEQLAAEQYKSPLLHQLVVDQQPNPISRWCNYWQQLVRLRSWVNITTQHLLIENTQSARQASATATAALHAFHVTANETNGDGSSDELVGTEIDDQIRQAATAIASALPASNDSAAGYVLLNPTSGARRLVVRNASVQPAPEPPVYAVSESSDSESQFVADVPAMGLLTVRPGSTKSIKKRRKKPLPPLAETNLVRNDFFEAKIDEATGGLRDLRLYNSRSNRISQQVALRTPGATSREPSTYSQMVASSVKVIESNSIYGCVESSGELRDSGGQPVAKFTQRYEVWRGNRTLGLTISLEPLIDLDARPWDHYFGSRFVWPNEAASLSRSLNDVQIPARGKRVEAPLMLEIDDGNERTSLLTGGLPYHRRTGRRSVDTLLITKGETKRVFRMGIGIDIAQPLKAALDMLEPDIAIPLDNKLPAADSAWLFHVATKHVVAVTWHPIIEGDQVIGFRGRFIETKGRKGKLAVRALHTVESATKIALRISDGQVNAVPQTLDHCEVAGDTITCSINAHEHADVEAIFATPLPSVS